MFIKICSPLKSTVWSFSEMRPTSYNSKTCLQLETIRTSYANSASLELWVRFYPKESSQKLKLSGSWNSWWEVTCTCISWESYIETSNQPISLPRGISSRSQTLDLRPSVHKRESGKNTISGHHSTCLPNPLWTISIVLKATYGPWEWFSTRWYSERPRGEPTVKLSCWIKSYKLRSWIWFQRGACPALPYNSWGEL